MLKVKELCFYQRPTAAQTVFLKACTSIWDFRCASANVFSNSAVMEKFAHSTALADLSSSLDSLERANFKTWGETEKISFARGANLQA